MESWLYYLGAIVAGYLIGSIPSGLIVGRLTRGIDVRNYGSGRTGTTNTLRVLGWRASLVVLVVDVAKGWLPVYLLLQQSQSPFPAVVAGMASLIGHNWPVFAGFRGGRGVTVGFGSLLALLPIAAAVALIVFVLVVAATRYVSAGSVLACALAFATALILLLLGQAGAYALAYTAIAAALIIFQHHDNLDRLRRGTERKLGESVRTSQT